MKRNNNILVTGSSGQLGKELSFIIKKHEESNKEKKFLFLNKNQLDISNYKNTHEFIKDNDINLVVNCAAYTNVELAESNIEECFNVNYEGVKNLVNALERNQGSLIHISTDYVFNGKGNIPYSENNSVSPINMYGKSKADGENAIITSSIPFVIIRTSWLYSRFGQNFMKLVINKLDSGEELNIIGDQVGSPTNAHDLASYILKVINKMDESNVLIRELIHFSNSGQISWFDFANEIKKLRGSNTKINKIKTSDIKFRAQRPKFSVLDTKKAKNFLSCEINDWKYSLSKCYQLYLDIEK
tara:strand:+ start:49 stop:948 length:900 start_codon:yes stop_codon:yes gene_type:complete